MGIVVSEQRPGLCPEEVYINIFRRVRGNEESVIAHEQSPLGPWSSRQVGHQAGQVDAVRQGEKTFGDGCLDNG
jgi:hypothetical protein